MADIDRTEVVAPDLRELPSFSDTDNTRAFMDTPVGMALVRSINEGVPEDLTGPEMRSFLWDVQLAQGSGENTNIVSDDKILDNNSVAENVWDSLRVVFAPAASVEEDATSAVANNAQSTGVAKNDGEDPRGPLGAVNDRVNEERMEVMDRIINGTGAPPAGPGE